MSLLEVRDKFVQTSGMLDLKNEDGSDNGAIFYINMGQKFLDQLVQKHEDIGRVFRVIEAGDYFVQFQNCRTIHMVGVGSSDSFNWLDRYQLANLRKKFNEPFSSISQTTPYCFAPAYLRPAGTEGDFDGLVGYMDVMSGWRNYNGVILLPPANQQYHVEIWGKFWSQKLVNDSDESYWTENFDYLLIMAAQRALEIFFRNTQGVQDWTKAIQAELFSLEQDLVEEMYYGFDQMEG